MNVETAMKWRGGTKGKPIVERMLNVFDLHFPTPAVEAMSRIYACKLREICIYLAGACNSNSHAHGLHYLTFVCKTRQGKSMQRGESSHENVSKELSVFNLL
jgi:hypothetical protein